MFVKTEFQSTETCSQNAEPGKCLYPLFTRVGLLLCSDHDCTWICKMPYIVFISVGIQHIEIIYPNGKNCMKLNLNRIMLRVNYTTTVTAPGR